MRVLVDTPVWSLALRRKSRSSDSAVAEDLAALVQDGRVAMIGPVRQELLSGLRDRGQFERLRDHLRAFPDTPITTEDHEDASSFYNRCRARGVQGSAVDFLICAVAVRNDFAIFTTDRDFVRFAKALPIKLHARSR